MNQIHSENRKRISRTALERLRQELLQPLQTAPPTIGSYSREIDVELFKLFGSTKTAVTRQDKLVTLGEEEIGRKREVWVYEKSPRSLVYSNYREVPRFTANTDDAFMLKSSVLGDNRWLCIEEIDDPYIPRWRAKLMSELKVVGEGETYDCAASVVLAILSDLIANDGASCWIEVTD